MMRVCVWAALPLAYSAASSALAEERCLAGEYRLPAIIAEDMRPYLLCGMIRGQGHHTVRLNGAGAAMHGGGLETCGATRSRALEAAERRLAPVMRDAGARWRLLDAEFGKADRFLRVAAASEDLGMGEEYAAPRCRDRNAQNR
jgi:hypothetical protein